MRRLKELEARHFSENHVILLQRGELAAVEKGAIKNGTTKMRKYCLKVKVSTNQTPVCRHLNFI